MDDENPTLLLDYDEGEDDGDPPTVLMTIRNACIGENDETGELLPGLRLGADQVDKLIAQLHQYRSRMRRV